MDNPKDLTPIFKCSDLHSDPWKWKCYPWFFQTVSHTLFPPPFLLTENNLLADVSKVLPKFCNVIFQYRQIVSVEYRYYLCASICMWDFLLSQLVVYTQKQLIQGLPTWLSASPSHDKTIVLELGKVCVPIPHKLPPLGVRGLWKSLGALLIAIRIRNVPAQIIHINNWNKNITLYIRLTATPRTKLTVYKNSYVKNLHKRQTKRKSSVQTFTEKKKIEPNTTYDLSSWLPKLVIVYNFISLFDLR